MIEIGLMGQLLKLGSIVTSYLFKYITLLALP